MAELIPTLNTCLPKMTSGEKRFARRLEKLLENDYLCWFDIPLGGKRRYPDFIILHPSRGLLFLEVKDWKAENLKRLSHTEADLLTPAGLKTVVNPVEQARQCSYQVLQLLERDAQLQQIGGKHKGKLCMPYGYGVVFTNITRQQFDRAIPEEHRSTLLPSHLMICKDEMTETAGAEDFQSRLWSMFNYQFGAKLTLPQIDRIRWHLFPEIRIDAEQMTLLGEPENQTLTMTEAIPDIVKIMDIQQEQLARSLGDGHRVVHGVAGSGKTLILGYRCLYLAEALHKPILVLCFNITLAARLRSFMSARGITEKVQVYHFHDWCGEQLRAYHVAVIKGQAPVWERQVTSVINAVERGEIPQGQYGALLIDEGHDFQADWLNLVAKMVDPETNSLLLLYDDAQSIYKTKGALKFSLASVGIKAQGRTTILKLNYRNTREIIEFAYALAKEYFNAGGTDDIPLIAPQAAGISGAKPVLKRFETLDAEIAYLIRCLLAWHKRGQAWRDIAILYPGGEAGKLIATQLKKFAIPCAWLAASQFKKHYNPELDQVSVLPIPSSKGLEFETVVVIDASLSPIPQAELDDDIRRLYVGLTRARAQLLVSYHRQGAIAEVLDALV